MTRPALLVLPGLLEDADAFHALINGLRDVADVRVADMTRGDSVAALARSALQQAPAGPLHLAGPSMGGYVALEILRQAPDDRTFAAAQTTATENRRRLMKLADEDFTAVVNALLPKLMTEAHVKDPALAGIISSMALAVGKEAFRRQEQAIIDRIDSRPHLAAIACPTLVVAGREDQLMPVAWLEELARGIPGARLVVIEGSGHMASMEKPREVIAAMREWITGRAEPMPEFPVEAPPPAS